MQKLKTIVPFFLAILLLFFAAFLPIFLCRLQDNSMLGVAHLEPLPTAEPFEEGASFERRRENLSNLRLWTHRL